MVNKKTSKSKTKEKSIALKNTVIYKEIKKRNLRLLITAIFLLVIGIISLIPAIFDRSIFFLIVAVVFFGISIYQFVLTSRRNKNIFHHPDMNHFLKWEDYGNYVITMNEELKQNKRTEFSHAFFTDSFVFIPTFYRLNWFHLSEVCWAFHHVTKHSVNLIPTGKTYEVHIYLDDGSLVQIKSDSAGEILHHLIKTAPFAHYGYSDELKDAWSNDTIGFINSVKHRMQQFFKNPEKFIKDNFEFEEQDKKVYGKKGLKFVDEISKHRGHKKGKKKK